MASSSHQHFVRAFCVLAMLTTALLFFHREVTARFFPLEKITLGPLFTVTLIQSLLAFFLRLWLSHTGESSARSVPFYILSTRDLRFFSVARLCESPPLTNRAISRGTAGQTKTSGAPNNISPWRFYSSSSRCYASAPPPPFF